MVRVFLRVDFAPGSRIGPGKIALLEQIDHTGSISAAAKAMGMSYRRAWELVDTMNRCFDEPLVTTSPGGAGGGGAQVTEFGRLVLKRYKSLVTKSDKLAAKELADILPHLHPFE